MTDLTFKTYPGLSHTIIPDEGADAWAFVLSKLPAP